MDRQYKDSGIEWIGRIPVTWETCQLKRLLLFQNGQDYKHVESEIGYPVYGSGGVFMHASQYLYDGEAVLFGRKGTIDRPLYVNEKFWTVDTMYYAIPHSQGKGKYLYYLATLLPYNKYQTSTALPSMTQTVLGNMIVTLPSIDEQQCIANYLDEKCGEIDTLIWLQEEIIEKLKAYKQSVITEAVTKGLDPNAKLVPSGIDWIGDIPEGWIVLPLKRICRNITDGSHFSPNTTGEGKPYITVSNVYGDKVHVEEAAKISIDDFSTLVANGCQPPTGSVLLAKDGTVGRTAVVHDNNYVVLSSLGILTPSNSVLSKYLKYLLDSDSLQAQMQLAMAGSALRRITITKICKLVGLLPPLYEQQVIVSYLDEKCADIDRLIEMKQQKIEKLKDYKKSVIYEAVTGKINIES